MGKSIHKVMGVWKSMGYLKNREKFNEVIQYMVFEEGVVGNDGKKLC